MKEKDRERERKEREQGREKKNDREEQGGKREKERKDSEKLSKSNIVAIPLSTTILINLIKLTKQ